MARMGAFTGPQTEFGVPLSVRHPADNVTDPSKVGVPATQKWTIEELLAMAGVTTQTTAKTPTATGASS